MAGTLLSKGIAGAESTLKFFLTMWKIVHEIAQLVFVLDLLDALSHHQHAKEMALVILWPCLPNFGAGVEEPSHGGAGGSNAANKSKLGHGEMRPLPISQFGTYVFLP